MRFNNNDRETIVSLIITNNEKRITQFSENQKIKREKDPLTKKVLEAKTKYDQLQVKLNEKYPYVDRWDVKHKIKALAELYVYNQASENKPIDENKDFFKDIVLAKGN